MFKILSIFYNGESIHDLLVTQFQDTSVFSEISAIIDMSAIVNITQSLRLFKKHQLYIKMLLASVSFFKNKLHLKNPTYEDDKIHACKSNVNILIFGI